MPGNPRQVPPMGPAPIAVHDNRYMLGEPFPVKPRINICFLAVQAGGALCAQQRNLCRFLNLTQGRPSCNETCGYVMGLIFVSKMHPDPEAASLPDVGPLT